LINFDFDWTEFVHVPNDSTEQLMLLCDDDFLKAEEYFPVITYIAGYVCFAINKKLQCIYCKTLTICNDGDVIKASFIKGISQGGLLFASPEMVRIALISYLVIINICESDEYQDCPSQCDFGVKLSQSVLEAKDFPFFSWCMCKGNHDLHTVVKMACWIYSNILLNNYCFKRNDQLSCDKLLSKKRKLQTLT